MFAGRTETEVSGFSPRPSLPPPPVHTVYAHIDPRQNRPYEIVITFSFSNMSISECPDGPDRGENRLLQTACCNPVGTFLILNMMLRGIA